MSLRFLPGETFSQPVSAVSQALSVETVNRISADAVLSEAVSVVSQALSAEVSARVAADALLSQGLSVLSNAVSVVSNAVSVVSAAVVLVSALATSALGVGNGVSNSLSAEIVTRADADSALSVRINTQSQGISVLSQQVSVLSVYAFGLPTAADLQQETSNRISADNALSTLVSALSQQLSLQISAISQAHSALSQAVSVADAALSVRINTQSQGISVLSQQVSVLSQQVSALSQAVSVADAALSVRINTQSQGISVLSQQVSVLSQTLSALSSQVSTLSDSHTSLVNRVSANSGTGGGGSVTSAEVSVAIAVETSDRISADNALSVRVDTQSQAISVLSNQVSGISAIISTLRGGTTGQVLKKVTEVDFVWSWQADVTGGAGSVDVTSAKISTLSQNISVVSQALSAETAARVSADNALSNLVSALSVQLSLQVSALSQVHSALSANVATLSTTVSAISSRLSALSAQVSTDISAISQVHSALSANVATISLNVSALSQRLSVLSQATSAADAALSVRIDTQSQAVSVLSQQVSALSQALSVETANRTSADNVLSAGISAAKFLALQNNDVSALQAGHPVIHFTSANTFFRANGAGNLSTRNVIGLVADPAGSIAVSATGAIQYAGVLSLTTAQWDAQTGGAGGLTPGVLYYLGAAGTNITTTPTTNLNRPLGVALSPTAMKLGIATQDDVMSLALDAFTSIAALSANVATISTNVSAISTRLSALSAKLSTDISAISQVHSALSANVATISTNVSAISTRLSALSAQLSTDISAISQAHSVLSQAVSVADAALSVRINTQSDAISVISNKVSGISAIISTLRGGTTGQVLKKTTEVDFVWAWQADITGGAGSVDVTSAKISQHSQAISVLSQQVSAMSALGPIVMLQNVDSVVVSAGTPVYLDGTSDTTFKRADATGSNSHRVIGLVIDNVISISATGRVQTDGLVSLTVDQWSAATSGIGLFPGDPYFLDPNVGKLGGQPTGASFVRPVGIAVSPTVLLLQLANLDNQLSLMNAGFSQLSDTASALSMRINVEASLRISSEDVFRDQISVLSAGVSVISNALSMETAARISADNALSTLISALSADLSVRASALSQQISVVSVAVAGLSTTVSAHSTAISGFSHLFSTLRGGTTGQVLKKTTEADFAWTWSVDNTGGAGSADVTSAKISTLSQNISVVSQALSVETADRISADAALSNLISALSVDVSLRLSAMSQVHSALSANVAGISTNVSALSTRLSALSGSHTSLVDRVSALDANNLSNQISILSVQISVLSQQVSVLSQAVSVLSVALDVISQAASVLSNAVSAAGGFVQRVVQGTAVISGGALSNVSGLSFTVSAGAVYNMNGIILFAVGALTVQGIGFGLSYPAMTRAFGKMEMAVSVGQQAVAAPAGSFRLGYFNAGHSNTAILSSLSTWGGNVGSTRGLFIDAQWVVSTTGTIQFLAKGFTGTSAVTVMPGSFLKLYKIL